LRQAELLQRADELVRRCDCSAGCPACVGPVLAAHEEGKGDSPKSLALTVLALLFDAQAPLRHATQVDDDLALDVPA
ncbi:hypothetical protein BRL98_00085, partial [Xanthomonas oryzae pv. oryzae]